MGMEGVVCCCWGGGGEFDLVSFSYHNGFPAAEVMVSKIKSSYGYSVHTRN